MKKFLKTTLLIVIINATTYCIYLLLWALGVLNYYEFSNSNGSENLPVSIYFFIFPLLIVFIIILFAEKFDYKTFLIEIFVFGLISSIITCDIINVSDFGLFEILKYIQYNFIHTKSDLTVMLKIISPVLSSLFYLTIIVIASNIKKNRKISKYEKSSEHN